MPSLVANLIALPQPTPASNSLATNRSASLAETSEQFQTVLEGTRRAEQAQQASAAESQDAIEAEADRRAELLASTLAITTQATATPFAGEPGVIAANVEAIPATGLTAQIAVNPAEVQSQANPAFPPPDIAPIARPETDATNAVPAPPTQPNTAAQTAPTQTTPVLTAIADATTAIQLAQRQVVPAQVPIVAGLLPAQPAVSQPVAQTPIGALQAPIAAAPLPDVRVGDRPNTAGEQFAALASTAATLTTTPALKTDTFATVLASNELAPTQLAESRVAERDFGEAPVPSGLSASLPTPFAAITTTPARAHAVAERVAVQVAEGIVTHAHAVERAGATEFRLRLDPPELGTVRVRLIANGDSINGQVVVGDDAVRRMIESQLPELRQRLEAAGVFLQRFDVSTDAGTGSGRNPYHADAPTEFARSGAAHASASRSPNTRTSSLLDVTV